MSLKLNGVLRVVVVVEEKEAVGPKYYHARTTWLGKVVLLHHSLREEGKPDTHTTKVKCSFIEKGSFTIRSPDLRIFYSR